MEGHFTHKPISFSYDYINSNEMLINDIYRIRIKSFKTSDAHLNNTYFPVFCN